MLALFAPVVIFISKTAWALRPRTIAPPKAEVIIEEALAKFGPPPACGGINLPPGVIPVSTTIAIENRSGCGLKGRGADPQGHSGTILHWAGPSGGAVISLINVENSRFSDFLVDGAGKAGVGLDIGGAKGKFSRNDLFMRIAVRGIRGSLAVSGEPLPNRGTAIRVEQARRCFFNGGDIEGGLTGVRQDGGGAQDNRYRDFYFAGIGGYAMDFSAGDANVENSTFHQQTAALADVLVRAGTGPALFIGNTHEDAFGPAYLFPTVGRRVFPTELLGIRADWANLGGRLIDYEQKGPLSIIASSFTKKGTGKTAIYIQGSAGGPPIAVTSQGNFYQGGVDFVAQGNVSVQSSDYGEPGLAISGTAQIGSPPLSSRFSADGSLTMAPQAALNLQGGEIRGLPMMPGGGNSAASRAYVDLSYQKIENQIQNLSRQCAQARNSYGSLQEQLSQLRSNVQSIKEKR
ncbi:MAG: hypothetical protein ACYCPQ_07505 [Elusimicrobiota bacterium]